MSSLHSPLDEGTAIPASQPTAGTPFSPMARRQAPRFDGNICSGRHQRRELQPGSCSALLRAHDLQCDALLAVQLGLWVTERTAASRPGLRAETRNSFSTDAINASWLSRRSARDLASALRVRRRGPAARLR
jgi:hypothetical protein